MTNRKGKKLEPKLYLDMDFGEALGRFTQTKAQEVAESIERAKKRRPPGNSAPSGKETKTDHEPPRRRSRKRSGGA